MKNRYFVDVTHECGCYLKTTTLSFPTLYAATHWAKSMLKSKGFIRASILDLQSNSIEWDSEHGKRFPMS